MIGLFKLLSFNPFNISKLNFQNSMCVLIKTCFFKYDLNGVHLTMFIEYTAIGMPWTSHSILEIIIET